MLVHKNYTETDEEYLPNFADEFEQGAGGERWLSTQEFIDNTPQGPDVSCVVVWLFLYQFWCHVQWSSLQHKRLKHMML